MNTEKTQEALANMRRPASDMTKLERATLDIFCAMVSRSELASEADAIMLASSLLMEMEKAK